MCIKSVRITMVAAALIALVACGQEPEALPAPTPTLTPASSPVPTPTPEPAAVPMAPAEMPTTVPTPPPAATVVPTATPPPPPTATTAPASEPTPVEPTPGPEAIGGPLFLQLINPEVTEVFVQEPNIKVVARTRVDAVITVNDTVVEPNADGWFELTVALELGANIIEVVVSVDTGEQRDLVLVVIYAP